MTCWPSGSCWSSRAAKAVKTMPTTSPRHCDVHAAADDQSGCDGADAIVIGSSGRAGEALAGDVSCRRQLGLERGRASVFAYGLKWGCTLIKP